MRVFEILIVMLIMSGCVSKPSYVPVEDSRSLAPKNAKTHIVKRGETLYSIAWRYNLNYRALAKINGVDNNFTIYPGQTLNLSAPKAVKTAVNSKKPNQKTVKKVEKKSNRSIKKTTPPVKKSVKPVSSGPLKWVWPTDGKLTSTFSSNNGLNKGIDIQGELGQPVLAASTGTVVYSGEGLRGYGKLVILKHNENFLSAYAHNRRLHVKEGDKVKIGQKIAAMGSTGTDSVKLHFEIRYRGKPVNPQKYLPPKK